MSNLTELLSGISSFENKVQEIQSKLFNVVKVPLTTPKMIDLDGMLQPTNFNTPTDIFGVYKENGGDCLGIVGKDYNPVQPIAFFDVFVNSILEANLDISKLELKQGKNDKKMRFRIPLKTIEVNNGTKLKDITDIYLNFETGFDGKTATSTFLETVRLVCLNGMRKSFTEQKTKFRNTKNNAGKAESIVSDIVAQTSNIDTIQQIYERMTKTQINEQIRTQYLKLVTGFEIDKYNDLSKRTQSVIDLIQSDIERELKDSEANIFALFNGITRYNNHTAKGSENKDFIFYDKGSKMNDKALEIAMQFSN